MGKKKKKGFNHHPWEIVGKFKGGGRLSKIKLRGGSKENPGGRNSQRIWEKVIRISTTPRLQKTGRGSKESCISLAREHLKKIYGKGYGNKCALKFSKKLTAQGRKTPGGRRGREASGRVRTFKEKE